MARISVRLTLRHPADHARTRCTPHGVARAAGIVHDSGGKRFGAMKFTLKQLRYLESAGRCRSVTDAAQELGISQSSILAALGSFESEIGNKLFLRNPANRLEPTKAGLQILERVQGLLEQFKSLEMRIAGVGNGKYGALRIASFISTSNHVLPMTLRGFVRDHAEISMEILTGDIAEISEFLESGKAHLALSFHMWRRNFEFIPLFSSRSHAVVSTNDELAGRTSVSLSDLAPKPMILIDIPQGIEFVKELFHSRGLTPNIRYTTRSVEHIRALIGAGLGYAIMNIAIGEDEQQGRGVTLRPISDEIADMEVGISVIPGVRQPPAAQLFIDHCLYLSQTGAYDCLVSKP